MKDNMDFLKLLALKGHKVSKEKLQFAQTQIWCLGHLIPQQRLYLDPGRLKFPKFQN